MLHYISMSELCQAAENRHKLIREIVLEDQAAQLEKEECELISTMEENLTVMLEAIENGSKADVRSMSGLSGGDAYRLKQVIDEGKHLCGDLLSNAVQMAMAVSEINAAMGKIVAAPTVRNFTGGARRLTESTQNCTGRCNTVVIYGRSNRHGSC